MPIGEDGVTEFEIVDHVITYPIPDKLFTTDTSLGKTSTQRYQGPDTLILYIDTNTGEVFESWWPDEEPYERPRAPEIERVVFKAETDTDYVKFCMLKAGPDELGEVKIYEVQVGPNDQANTTLADPTDIRIVYQERECEMNWEADPVFKVYDRNRDDDWLRDMRNAMLEASDVKVAPDMPDEIRNKWLTYRQQLRDLPVDWADCPNWLIKFPVAPDERDMDFEDPDVHVIRIEDRTDEDQAAVDQLPDGVE